MPYPAPLVSTAIAEALGGRHRGPERVVDGISPLSEPRSGTLSFCVDPVAAAELLTAALSVGAIVLVPPGTATTDAATAIEVEHPRGAFAEAVRAHFVARMQAGVHPTAIVDATAIVAATARVGPYTVIGARVRIGDGTDVRAHVVIGDDVTIGDGCLIKSHAVLGEEGLGIDQDADGNPIRIPHLGGVILHDRVEVGSFSTVCAGTITPTVIGAHTKVDDHVHIAHNVHIGERATIVGNAELAGSVRVGDRGWVGPNASVLNGITIGSDTVIGIGAVVVRDVADGETWFGNPARRVPSVAQ